MEVTIDKFGRILIPKQIRKKLGLKPGQQLELIADEQNKSIDLISKEQVRYELKLTKSGIPVFHFTSTTEADFNVVDLIRQTREERDAKIQGL